MKLLFSLVAVVVLLASASAHAESVQRNHDQQRWSLDDLLNDGARALGDAVGQGLAFLEDHVTLQYRRGPASRDEETARFGLHIFPNGKSHPSNRYGVEGRLRYMPDASSHHFHFDLKVIEPTEPSRDYI